jgi:hypothetical protein
MKVNVKSDTKTNLSVKRLKVFNLNFMLEETFENPLDPGRIHRSQKSNLQRHKYIDQPNQDEWKIICDDIYQGLPALPFTLRGKQSSWQINATFGSKRNCPIISKDLMRFPFLPANSHAAILFRNWI